MECKWSSERGLRLARIGLYEEEEEEVVVAVEEEVDVELKWFIMTSGLQVLWLK